MSQNISKSWTLRHLATEIPGQSLWIETRVLHYPAVRLSQHTSLTVMHFCINRSEHMQTPGHSIQLELLKEVQGHFLSFLSSLAPRRSTLRMSMPILQETTASAVMAVSQSFTCSTLCPALKFDHSRTKARVLAKICGAKLLILI